MTDTHAETSAPWTRRFLWLIAGVVAFRVAFLFLATDFQLAGDEVYYWDWGRRPDWGYYSKPPLIGWLMGLIGWASGDSWHAVRLTSILFGTITLSLMFLLGRRLFDARTGFFAALLFLLTPANAALNNAMTIDAPLMLCWTLALLLFWQAVQKPQSWGTWLGLMLVIGTGTLAKQMMLVFPALMILFLALSTEQRVLLKRSALWLCALGGLSFLTPTLLWNQKHGWITLKHTSEHFQSETTGFGDWLSGVVSFPLMQAAFYSPITWVLLIAVLIGCAKRWRGLSLSERFLWMFSAPGLIIVTGMALRQHVNENWPAVFYLSAFVLLPGVMFAKRLPLTPTLSRQGEGASFEASLSTSATPSGSSVAGFNSRWLIRALWVGGAMAALLYVMIPTISLAGLRGHKTFDPLRDMRGWREAGPLVGEYFAKVPRPEQTFVLVVNHRHNASQMAYWMPQHPRVYRWNKAGAIESQYEIWPNAADKIGNDAFIIDPLDEGNGYENGIVSAYVTGSFEKVERLGRVDVDIGNGYKRAFQLWLGTNMKRWPNDEKTFPDRNP